MNSPSGTRELELLYESQGGSSQALGELLNLQQKWLTAYAGRLDPSLGQFAEDWVQEAFLRVSKTFRETFEIREGPEALASFRSFLTTIVRSVALDYQKSAYRRLIKFESNLYSPDDAGLDGKQQQREQRPSRILGWAEAARQLQSCLEGLPPKYKQVIELKYTKEMSYQDIGQQLAISDQAVKGVLDRARRQLKECLGNASGLYLSGRD